jgi:hypothetical protein
VEALWERCPEVKRVSDLAHTFAGMVRERKAPELDGWIAQTREAGVPRGNSPRSPRGYFRMRPRCGQP